MSARFTLLMLCTRKLFKSFRQCCWKICNAFEETICTTAAPLKIIESNSGTLSWL